MGFLDDFVSGESLGGPLSTLLVGIGAVLITPSVASGVGTTIRPVIKSAIKGGLMLYEAASETVAEAGEQINDLIAEVRHEMRETESDPARLKSGIIVPGEEHRGAASPAKGPLVSKPGEEKKSR